MDSQEINRIIKDTRQAYLDQPAPHWGNSAAQCWFLEDYRQARIMWPDNITMSPRLMTGWLCLFRREHNDDPMQFNVDIKNHKSYKKEYKETFGEIVPY